MTFVDGLDYSVNITFASAAWTNRTKSKRQQPNVHQYEAVRRGGNHVDAYGVFDHEAKKDVKRNNRKYFRADLSEAQNLAERLNTGTVVNKGYRGLPPVG